MSHFEFGENALSSEIGSVVGYASSIRARVTYFDSAEGRRTSLGTLRASLDGRLLSRVSSRCRSGCHEGRGNDATMRREITAQSCSTTSSRMSTDRECKSERKRRTDHSRMQNPNHTRFLSLRKRPSASRTAHGPSHYSSRNNHRTP